MLGTRRFTITARTSSPGVGIPFMNDFNIPMRDSSSMIFTSTHKASTVDLR